jgi:hypothetical protein
VVDDVRCCEKSGLYADVEFPAKFDPKQASDGECIAHPVPGVLVSVQADQRTFELDDLTRSPKRRWGVSAILFATQRLILIQALKKIRSEERNRRRVRSL